MKANSWEVAKKQLLAENLKIEDLASSTLRDGNETAYNFLCVKGKQVGMSMSFDARVVAVDQNSYKRNKGFNESFFDLVVLIHDPTKKVVAKKAPAKVETK